MNEEKKEKISGKEKKRQAIVHLKDGIVSEQNKREKTNDLKKKRKICRVLPNYINTFKKI